MNAKKSIMKKTKSLLAIAMILSLCFTVLTPVPAYATADEAIKITGGEISGETGTASAPEIEDETAAETEGEDSEEADTPTAPAEGAETDTENEESGLTGEDTTVPDVEEEETGTPSGEQGLFQLNTFFAPMGGQGTAQLTVESVEADAGNPNVSVDVSIADCPDFYAIILQVNYDQNALTLKSITRGPATSAAEGNFTANPNTGRILFNGTLDDGSGNFYMTASDDVLFTLVFEVAETAGGDYEIEVDVEQFLSPYEQDLPINVTNGVLTVTPASGAHEATYDNKYYVTLEAALAAVGSGTGTITMLKDKTISDFDERIVIPTGANITLDLNGHTITSAIPCAGGAHDSTYVVEVEEGATLNLVDNSDAKGGQFVHTTGDIGTTFLRNAGTLNMSDVDVRNFFYGILDNSTTNVFNGNPGTYGIISNCDFTTVHRALNFEEGSVNTIKGCSINMIGGEGGGLGAYIALYLEKGGIINLLEDCHITSEAQNTVQISGRIETIMDCTIVNERIPQSGEEIAAIFLNNGASIGTITSTSPEKHTSITGTVRCVGGSIDLIEGEDTLFKLPSIPAKGSEWYNIYVGGNTDHIGEIGTIAGGRFEEGDCTLFVGTNGRIGTISGGIFTKTVSEGYYNVYNGGIIETISGGVFNNSTASYDFGNVGTVNLISGGKFYSTKGPAILNFSGGTINTISGGEFCSTSSSAIWNYTGGTINSITDSPEGRYPRFSGKSVALDNAATIQSLTGGYYRTETNNSWITAGSATIPEGYDFSTVPMRSGDMDDEEDYYHFGETVDITWQIEGQEDKTDKFVKGDPVYYNYETPSSEGKPFSGWRHGDTLYKAGDPLPVATADATYVAEFLPGAEDYQVSLVNAPTGVYSGQDFTVDVIITSESNTKFYGATIDVTFDNSKVTFNSQGSSHAGFGITSSTSGTTTTLTIVGAAENGYSMAATDGGYTYTVATLAFTANRDETGEAVFAIGEGPVVDQEDVVLPVAVGKGDDVTVTLSQIIVSFNSNGGSAVPDQVLNYGDKVTEPENPTQYGKYFQGWYTDEGLTTLYNFVTTVTESFTLYAKWGDNEYTLKYNAGPNGSIEGDEEQTVIHGQSGTQVEAVPDDGYQFVQWSDGSTANPRTDTNVTGDITVTAEFAPIEYTITYHLDGGTNHPDNPATYTIENETITLKDATRTGYTFEGWYDAASDGNEVTQIAKGSTGDIDLYAYWTAIEYTVTFDSNGGDTPIPESKLVTYDQPYGELATVTRTGHTFLGWFTEPEGGTEITAESIVKTAADHTLHAQWEHNIYTVTFKAGANVSMNEVVAYVKHYTKADDLGIWADATCETPFTEPTPVAANGYTLDDPVWQSESGSNVSFDTIRTTQFTGPAVYTATASPSKYDVTYDSSRVSIVSGVTAGKATYLTDIVFTVVKKTGYIPVVKYAVGDGGDVLMTAENGKYTISGEVILGDITITISDTLEGEVSFIDNVDHYKALPDGYKLLLFSAPAKLNSGAYEYDGNAMFYSSGYSTAGGAQVYLYVVPDGVLEQQAKDNIQIDEEAEPCTELAYDGDVNLDGRIISTDAVLTYGLYKGLHENDPDFTKVGMRMRLEADVNNDKKVDTFDAVAILNKIWGKE